LRRLSRDIPRKTQLRAALAAVILASFGFLAPVAAELPSVARGAYLAGAAGCEQCHTDARNGGRPYAGGRALDTPYGTVFTPNITPDRETGVGRWQVGEFEQALRWGIAPDGSHYLPAFPFPFYNRLMHEDLDDLKAFLDGLPAVSQVNRTAGPTLFSAARAAITVVAEGFPGPWQPDATKDAAWNRGAYLVATIGRCGDCHTPRNWLGTPEPARLLAGTPAGPGGKAVPNITPDSETGIGQWSIGDIVILLRDGQTPDFDFVGGAMAEIVRNTSRFTDDDRRAIAIYLRSLPAIHFSARANQ
jgi:mono/diheme cytochrome c family protein